MVVVRPVLYLLLGALAAVGLGQDVRSSSSNSSSSTWKVVPTATSILTLTPLLLQHYRPYYQFGYQVKDSYTDDFHGHMEYSKGDTTRGETWADNLQRCRQWD